VADIDIASLIRFHKEHGRLATLTAVRPPSRFGLLELDEQNAIHSFDEKPTDTASWINGGFFVLSPDVLDLIKGDDSVWERAPLQTLAAKGELRGYKHYGFWQPMDTLWEKRQLEELWNGGKAPWKVW